MSIVEAANGGVRRITMVYFADSQARAISGDAQRTNDSREPFKANTCESQDASPGFGGLLSRWSRTLA